MRLHYRAHFDAAHHLPGYDGPCGRVHGHRWEVEITIEGEPDPTTGMIVDFSSLKEKMDQLLPDHLDLNKFIDPSPTAENVARILFRRFKEHFPDLIALRLWESPEASVEVTG